MTGDERAPRSLARSRVEELPTLDGTAGAPAAPVDPQLAPLAARYDILGELGRGGMGVVVRARDRETDEIVALKVLKPEIAAQSEAVERFKAELRLARRITHKHVCRTYELLRFGDTVAIAMEYVPGESLRAFLQRFGSAPLRRGLQWARQIAEALGEAHAQGIVHRDLKPENVILDRQGQARVLDFGIARSLDTPRTHTGAFVGTPSYMSPEQAQGAPADARSDVYALGLLLYEMFAGRVAFTADTPVAVALKQIQEPPVPPREVEPCLPRFLERVIVRCLEKDPARRYASMADLLADLEERLAPVSGVAAATLPAHLTQGTRADVLWAVAAAAGLAVFLWAMPKVQPDGGVRLHVTRPMLVDKAVQELTRRGFTTSASPMVTQHRDNAVYMYLAQRLGGAVARERISSDLPPYYARLRFTSEARAAATVEYELDGRLRSVELPVVGWVPVGEGLPRAEALTLAREEMARSFGVAVEAFHLEYGGPLAPQEGRRGHGFQWVHRDPSGLLVRYSVNVYDRVTTARRSISLPEGHRPPAPRPWAAVLFFSWLVPPLALFLGRRLFVQVQTREVLTLAGVAWLWALGVVLEAIQADAWPFALIGAALIGCFVTAALIVVSSTTASLSQPRWPLTTSYDQILRWCPPGRALGLALLRGAMIGLTVSGLVTAARLAASTWQWAILPLALYDARFLASVIPLSIMVDVLQEALFVSLFVAFVLALVRRWVPRATVAAIVTGGLCAVAALGSPVASGLEAALAFALGAAATFVAARFDLLTLIVAAGTLTLWTRFFVLTDARAPVGAGTVWLVFAAWGLAVLFALYLAFQPFWARAARRFGGTFDE